MFVRLINYQSVFTANTGLPATMASLEVHHPLVEPQTMQLIGIANISC